MRNGTNFTFAPRTFCKSGSTHMHATCPDKVDGGARRSRAEWRATANSKPRGKVPTDMFGKPCTWGGAQGWLDSRMEPHIVVRDAARTASRAQNRQMKQQQRAIASKERHQRKAAAARASAAACGSATLRERAARAREGREAAAQIGAQR